MRPLFALACLAMLAAAIPARGQPSFAADFFEQHCYACHDAEAKKGDLDLTALTFDLAKKAGFERWVKVHDAVRDGEMPPKKKPQPSRKERQDFVSSLSEALAAADRTEQANHGRTVFRRLNRTEYEHTLRDLLGLPHLDVREMLPADGEAHGFDTVGAALNLSYVQIAKYLETADHALDKAIALAPAPEAEIQNRTFANIGRFQVKSGDVRHLGDARIILRQPNSAQTPWKIDPVAAPSDGEYRLRLSCYGLVWSGGIIRPADRPHSVTFIADLNKVTRPLQSFDIQSDKASVIEARVRLKAGERINLHFDSLDDRNEPSQTAKQAKPYTGPGIALEWFEMEGPFNASGAETVARLFGDLPVVPWTPESGLREPAPLPGEALVRGKVSNKRPAPMMVVSKQPEADAARLLRVFAERAFRRPLPEVEVERCLPLVRKKLEQKFTFHEAMRAGFKAVLCSPDFLFFHEPVGPLDDHALASRLSYFLWKSMPDETLLALAASGEIAKPAMLRAQTERLLNDPRSQRFVDDFLDQWLELRRIGFTEPDKQIYPEFTPLLQDSMVAETRAFFATMLRENLSADHLVRSDFTFANAPLAMLYDIPGVEGVELLRVSFPSGSPRGGFLTQGSVLKVTANGTTTSPVTRGAWIRERILGKPVPPPPPGAGSIEPDVRGTTTIREQLDKHRSVESCAGCHQKIDPPGFALESFNVMGGWRERYRSLDKGEPAKAVVADKPVRYKLGLPVDASGETESGEPFHDIHEFRALLLKDPAQLARNLTERLIVYATGAGISFADRAEVERIINDTANKGHGARDLIHAVVQSPIFQSK